MASTYSDLKIELIGTGDQSGTWGSTTNSNLGNDVLGAAIAGSADVTFSSADVTVTLTDTVAAQTARNLRLNLTGTTGGARNLILGSGCQIEKPYLINNGTADTITVKNTTGTGIAVPAGKSMWVYNNGTNVVDAVTHLTSLTLGSALPIASGGTGSTSTTFVDLTTNVTGDLPFSNLAQGSALSVLGVTGNATADVASIAAGTDNQVLRRSGTAVAFGAVNLASTDAVTGDLPFSNLAQGSALSVLGVTGNATADVASIAAGTDNQVLRRSGTSVAFGAVNLASTDAVTGDLPFSNLAQGSALSVLGVTGNATADVASIAAGTDNQVLRRSGTSVAFGAVNLASTNAVTGTLPAGNGGTGITSLGSGVATWLGTPSSANLAAAVTDETGSGLLVFATSPTLTTPDIGVATATSVNKVTITAPASSATLTIANGKTLTANNSIALTGTDSTTMTFPSTNATIARTDSAQTFTGAQTFGTAIAVGSGGTGISSGTSGGVPYFSASTTIASSAALAANAIVIGGGAGVAPSTTTTGTGVVTAIGNNTNAASGLAVLNASGNLGVAQGGTNATATPTAGAVAYGTGSAYAFTAAGTSGYLLQSNGSSAPTWVPAPSSGVTTISFGSTGLTPSTATSGAVSVAGTLAVGNGGTGATTLTSNNVILGNGSSAVQFVAPGSSGNVLTSNGTTWASSTPAASGSGYANANLFTSSGSFVAPVTGSYRVKAVGGGGSGAAASGSNNQPAMASGGGAGGLAIKVYQLTAGTTYTVTIGAGGTSVTANASTTNGNAGGATTFSGSGITTITANGGGGGNSSAGSIGTSTGASGGTASGGDTNLTGGGSGSASSTGSVQTKSAATGGGAVAWFGTAYSSGTSSADGFFHRSATGGAGVGGVSANKSGDGQTGGGGSGGSSTGTSGGPAITTQTAFAPSFPLVINGVGGTGGAGANAPTAGVASGPAGGLTSGAGSGGDANSSISPAGIFGGGGGAANLNNGSSAGAGVFGGGGGGSAGATSSGTTYTNTSGAGGSGIVLIEW